MNRRQTAIVGILLLLVVIVVALLVSPQRPVILNTIGVVPFTETPTPTFTPTPTVTPSPTPDPRVRLEPGDDIQAAVDESQAGTEFLIASGIHRMQAIEPKDGNIFTGEDGAVLNGARLLTEFEQDGDLWFVTGQEQGRERDRDVCQETRPRCNLPEDLFFDGEPLLHVASLDEVEPGTYYFDYEADTIYFADDPEGRTVETSVAFAAFDGEASDVTIRNLTIEKYANLEQFGAVNGVDSDGWLVENVTVQDNHGTGVRIGNNMTVRDSRILRSGQLGIGGLGDNVLVEGNEIAYNNVAGYRAGWEGGGSKFVRTLDLVVRDNLVHNNLGPGLWTDIDNRNTLYEDNVVINNRNAGIFHEISYDATIRNNTVMYNGNRLVWLWESQILVSSAGPVDVHDNLVVIPEDRGNGIGVLQQERGEGEYGVWLSYDSRVFDNTVVYTANSGVSGASSDWQPEVFWEESNLMFDNNTYYAPIPEHGRWEFSGARQNWEGMQAEGQELNSTVISDPAPAELLEIPADIVLLDEVFD